MEGAVLFGVLLIGARYFNFLARKKLCSGVFLVGYALARTTAEFFREPDAHLGFIFEAVTMGQILSMPMLILGLYLILTHENNHKKRRA